MITDSQIESGMKFTTDRECTKAQCFKYHSVCMEYDAYVLPVVYLLKTE
jgi:hypothetical protein